MFNIGFTEILVVALVSIIALDKNKIPVFIDFIKVVYRYIMMIKLKTKKLLKDAGIEELYRECNTEEVKHIVGKNGKLYPIYDIDNASKGFISKNDSEDSSSR
jgi:sec-independent protein translocase protein TatB